MDSKSRFKGVKPTSLLTKRTAHGGLDKLPGGNDTSCLGVLRSAEKDSLVRSKVVTAAFEMQLGDGLNAASRLQLPALQAALLAKSDLVSHLEAELRRQALSHQAHVEKLQTSFQAKLQSLRDAHSRNLAEEQQAWQEQLKLQQASTGSDKLDSSNARNIGSGNALEEKEDLIHQRRTRPTSVPLVSRHRAAQLARTSASAAPEVSGVKLTKAPKLVTESVGFYPAGRNLLKSSSQTQNTELNSTRPESTSGNRGQAFPPAEPFPNHSAEAQETAAQSSTGSDQLSSMIGAEPGLHHGSAESAVSVKENCILHDSSKYPSHKKVAVGSMADVVALRLSDCSEMESPTEPEHQAIRRQSMHEDETAILQTRIAELEALVEELQQVILLGCQERVQLQNQLQQTGATIPTRQQLVAGTKSRTRKQINSLHMVNSRKGF